MLLLRPTGEPQRVNGGSSCGDAHRKRPDAGFGNEPCAGEGGAGDTGVLTLGGVAIHGREGRLATSGEVLQFNGLANVSSLSNESWP